MPTFTPIPDLPAKGARVTIEQMQHLCEAKGLPHLWQRITADPPRKPFASDGCSLFFNQIAGVSIYPACFFHDLKYWAGYPTMDPAEQLERFVADAELMIDVASLGVDLFVAETMFRGVRTGGAPGALPFAWGFGRT
jgi:hypothetical protein